MRLHGNLGRRQFLSMLASLSVFAGSAELLAGCAGIGSPTRPARVPHVGYLDGGQQPVANLADHPFSQGLRQLGYVEGKTIVVDYRFAGGPGNANRSVPEIVGELISAGVEVLVTEGGGRLVPAVRQASATIPIVVAGGGDPVVLGLAASHAQPGGNVTGNNNAPQSLPGKRLELLYRAAPALATVGVLWQPTSPTVQQAFDVTQQAAVALGLKVVSMEAPAPDDIDGAFQIAGAAGVNALVLPTTGYFDEQVPRLVSLAKANRLPSIAPFSEWAQGGGLLAYGPNQADLRAHAAVFVDKILKGAKAGDLPIEDPTKFDFVINLKAAQALGLTIPPSMLAQATEVIQ